METRAAARRLHDAIDRRALHERRLEPARSTAVSAGHRATSRARGPHQRARAWRPPAAPGIAHLPGSGIRMRPLHAPAGARVRPSHRRRSSSHPRDARTDHPSARQGPGAATNIEGHSNSSVGERSAIRPCSWLPDTVAVSPRSPGDAPLAATPRSATSASTLNSGVAPARGRLSESARVRISPCGASPSQRSAERGASATASGQSSSSRSCLCVEYERVTTHRPPVELPAQAGGWSGAAGLLHRAQVAQLKGPAVLEAS